MKHTIALLLLLAVTVLPSQAQGPATPKPTTPTQNPAGAIPSVSNAAVPAVKPAAPVPGGVRGPQQVKQHNPLALACRAGQIIDGSNWDDQGVADAYSGYTGKRVLLSSATQNLEIRFYQRGPLTNREAANLLVKVLDMEGFVFVPSGANEVKLLPKAQGTGANGPSELEGIIDDPANIPDGDTYISYFMKLGFIKPEEAVRTFTQSIHGLGPGAKIAPVPNASAVLITGKATFVRKLINQQRYIDVAAGNVSTAWVQLKFADAEELATTLNEIMNAQQQRKTTAGVTTAGAARSTNTGNRPPVPGKPAKTATSAGTTAAGEDIPVQIVASQRLNKIFIMGRPVDIVFVEGLAREFDSPTNKNNFIKIKLRFVIASDFLQVAADALEAAAGPTASSQGGNARNNRSQTNQTRNQATSRNQNGQNGSRNSIDSVEAFNVSEVPESIVIGKTFIVADNLANSILVQGPPESLRIVTELIDKLDGRPQQVMISTVFGQVSLGDDLDFGVSLGRLADGGSRQGAGTTGGAGALQDLSTLGSIAGLNTAAGASVGGLNLYGRIKDFTGTLRALESQTNFKVLSRPTVYTANNRVAVISSGRRIAVPTNTFTSGANTGTTQSTNIEYRDVLLRFEVVPLINSEHEVTLRISLLNEDTQDSQEIDGNFIPTIVTESISTTVTVANNSTVVLGGLVTESSKITKSGVPILSRIPGLGRLFGQTQKDVDRRELLIFIQPQIVVGEESQQQAQSDMERRYNASKPTRDFADGILPEKPRSQATVPDKQAPAIPAASQRPYLRYPTRR
jgi:type II secretion system protein D